MVYSEKHKHSLCQHRKMRFLQPPVIPVSIFSTLGPPISKHSWGYVQDHPSKHSWGYVQSHPFLQQLLSEGAPSTVHKAQLLVFCFCFVFFPYPWRFVECQAHLPGKEGTSHLWDWQRVKVHSLGVMQHPTSFSDLLVAVSRSALGCSRMGNLTRHRPDNHIERRH